MSKELEALQNIHSHWNCCNPNSNGCDDKDFEIIENALKDYEWLKSIIPIDAMFMWNLSSDDKIRLLKIMGVELWVKK